MGIPPPPRNAGTLKTIVCQTAPLSPLAKLPPGVPVKNGIHLMSIFCAYCWYKPCIYLVYKFVTPLLVQVECMLRARNMWKLLAHVHGVHLTFLATSPVGKQNFGSEMK